MPPGVCDFPVLDLHDAELGSIKDVVVTLLADAHTLLFTIDAKRFDCDIVEFRTRKKLALSSAYPISLTLDCIFFSPHTAHTVSWQFCILVACMNRSRQFSR